MEAPKWFVSTPGVAVWPSRPLTGDERDLALGSFAFVLGFLTPSAVALLLLWAKG